MIKKQKYDINNFYVGELYLSYQFGNLMVLSKLTEEEMKERRKVATICMNGAIDFQKDLINSYTNWENRRSYQGVLTIFYKKDDKYISLHNGMAYDSFGDDFCDNLVPLLELLPKVDFNKPTTISTKEAIKFFDILFKKSRFNRADKLYNQIEHSTQDFYVGNLNLYKGFLPDNKRENRYQYSDLSQKYVLYRSNAILGGMYQRTGENKDDYGLVYDSHDSADFTCLFLIQPNGLYNVHNYQIYNLGNLKKEHFDNKEFIGESDCDCLISFQQYLDEGKIVNASQSITIPKALKLYRKVK